MSRKIGIAGILLASMFWLAGCALLMPNTGPCYGMGCHASLLAPDGAAKQNAQARPASAKKSRGFLSWLRFWNAHAVSAANGAPANSPSASAEPNQASPGND
jgi:hypothetical protein